MISTRLNSSNKIHPCTAERKGRLMGWKGEGLRGRDWKGEGLKERGRGEGMQGEGGHTQHILN